MGNSVSSTITDLWLANHQRRVKNWLDDAIEESVLDALTTSFLPGGKGYGGLPAVQNARPYIKETFDAYGSIDDIDKKRYWHEKDLELFLSDRFQGSELTSSIPVLWRCFHFHAYFPFPQEPHRLDYGAFQRAIGFLAAEGNLRLGDNADGITMNADRYPDESVRASKRLWMLFRSLSSPSSSSSGSKLLETNVANLSDTEEDLMEVLALTQPDNPCIMPAPIEVLRPHARRILSSSTPYKPSMIPRGDFLSLLKLMLSVQLDKPEWGDHEPYFYTGRIPTPPDSDTLQGAAEAILRKCILGEDRDIDWHSFRHVLNICLPDLLSQFRLIFTSFLSPLPATNQTLSLPTPKSTIPVPYAQYLNLFLHPPLAHPKRHVFEEFARQEAHYFLQTTQSIYTASSPTLNTTDLITALKPIKTGTLLLITGEATSPNARAPQRVTIGACMPTPWDLDRQRAFRASPPQKLHRYTPKHMLFQLEPSLEIVRADPNAWIMDQITITTSDPANGTKGKLCFGAEGSSGLFIDLDSQTATFKTTTNPLAHNSPPATNSAYHTITPSPSPSTNPKPLTNNNFSSTLHIHHLALYPLPGHITPPFEETLDPKPQLRTPSPKNYQKQDMKKGGSIPVEGGASEAAVVGGEELRRRIEGFGSG